MTLSDRARGVLHQREFMAALADDLLRLYRTNHPAEAEGGPG
ncbi:MAG: hypothetical protein DHS20C21_00330 [Gemmatimonadota bacterium]|nr:MAG: hypothetical protein DHS20C21_00330 [Gemmatimonadota bacterium]